MRATVWGTMLVVASLSLATAAHTQQGSPPASPDSVAETSAVPIQPGDQVTLRILREPDMGGTFTVSEAGEIVLPRLGRVVVSEFSAPALQNHLVSEYSAYLRDPTIDVTVLRRIGVQGEVLKPDVYMVDLTVDLRDLIARAGGVTHAGDPNDITIIRGGERIPVGEGEVASFTAAELRSGDQIVVGRRSWIALNPAVAVSTGISLISFVVTMVLLANDNGR